MALIDVDARMFDPARRPDALQEANVLSGSPLTEEQVEQLSDGISGMFPEQAEDVSDFLDQISRYLAFAAVNIAACQLRLEALED